MKRSFRHRASGRSNAGGGAGPNGRDLWAHGYGRAAMERMMRIHRKIEDREYPNCTKMSADFEVSVRTLKRDIEFMKDRLNMPIAFDVPKNGYFFTRTVPHFPRVPLTEREIVGLFVAQKTIAQYQGTSLQPVLDSAFRKMTAQLDDRVQYSLDAVDEVTNRIKRCEPRNMRFLRRLSVRTDYRLNVLVDFKFIDTKSHSPNGIRLWITLAANSCQGAPQKL